MYSFIHPQPHTKEETAQRGRVTCSRLHRQAVVEQGLNCCIQIVVVCSRFFTSSQPPWLGPDPRCTRSWNLLFQSLSLLGHGADLYLCGYKLFHCGTGFSFGSEEPVCGPCVDSGHFFVWGLSGCFTGSLNDATFCRNLKRGLVARVFNPSIQRWVDS